MLFALVWCGSVLSFAFFFFFFCAYFERSLYKISFVIFAWGNWWMTIGKETDPNSKNHVNMLDYTPLVVKTCPQVCCSLRPYHSPRTLMRCQRRRHWRGRDFSARRKWIWASLSRVRIVKVGKVHWVGLCWNELKLRWCFWPTKLSCANHVRSKCIVIYFADMSLVDLSRNLIIWL